jgi:hypothetical protein
VVDEQFGQLIVTGTEARQAAVVPPHPAVGAVLPAMIGNLDHGAQEDPLAKSGGGSGGGAGVKQVLGFAARVQQVGILPDGFIRHAGE